MGANIHAMPPLLVLGWRDHCCWPVRHNAARALAALRTGQAVLLVRAGAPRSDRPYRDALFPTDFSEASLGSLRRVLRALPGVRFTLLHAFRLAGEESMRAAGVTDAALDDCRRRRERRARAAGERFAMRARRAGLRLVVLARRQPWAPALAAFAAGARPDLLVLAPPPGGFWAAWRLRGELRLLLSRTACDLMLLPAPAPDAPRAKCAARGAGFVP